MILLKTYCQSKQHNGSSWLAINDETVLLFVVCAAIIFLDSRWVRYTDVFLLASWYWVERDDFKSVTVHCAPGDTWLLSVTWRLRRWFSKGAAVWRMRLTSAACSLMSAFYSERKCDTTVLLQILTAGRIPWLSQVALHVVIYSLVGMPCPSKSWTELRGMSI